MTTEPPNSEQLQAIRDADAAAGEDLQTCPAAWTHRRMLLASVDAMEEVQADKRRLVRELDVLLNGESGAAEQASLCDIVAQIRRMKLRALASAKTVTVSTVATLQDTCPHGYKLEDLLTGAAVCDAGCEVKQ